MADLVEIIDDLRAEHDTLDAIVAALRAEDWDAPTPAEGWSIRDQITHLAFFDEQAHLAVADRDGFSGGLGAAAEDPLTVTERPLAEARLEGTGEVLGRWRAARAAMLESFAGLEPDTRIPWYGPAMSAKSFVTARLMETWAHGQDVADALGMQRNPTDRLKHIVHIGVRALPYAYTVRKLDVPSEPVRVEVTSPSGEVWTWGPDDATNVVRGNALDLALVVIQRRHRDDTSLAAEGAIADEWLSIAQAFAGPAGPGRKSGQFA